MRYLLFFLLLTQAVSGQTPDFVWTPGLQQAYSDLLKGRLQPARQTLAAEAPGRASANGLRIYLDNYADMMALLSSDDDRLLSQLANREAERLDQLEALGENSPYQRLLLAEVRLHWAFVKLKFGKEAAAGWGVIKAYKLLAENQRLFPNFLPTYKSLGVLRVMIGSVPDSYAWVPRLLGLRGNIRDGLADLQRALANEWRLPALIAESTAEAKSVGQTSARIVALAARLARHTARGWDNPALPDDLSEISALLNLSPEATLKLLMEI